MKNLKKLASLLLALVMVMGLSVTAFAAQTYTITVKNGYKGETYTAYKIFDVTYTDPSYAYTITNTTAPGEWFDDIVGDTTADASGDYTLSKYGIKFQHTGTDGLYNVVNAETGTNPTADQMALLAAVLAGYTSGKTAAGTGTVALDTGDTYGAKADVTINVNPDEAGYYFVTTTTGSLCALDTTNPNAEVQEKNMIPDIDKKQAIDTKPTGAAGYMDDAQNVQIGDTVYYQIEVKDGKGTNAEIKVDDILSNGLTLKSDATIEVVASINNAAEATVVATNYTINSRTSQGFTITFNADYVSTLTETDKVYIRFPAVVNSAAATDTDASKENNTATITYANLSKSDTVDVVTYKFQLDKSKSDYSDLLGAKFELYRGSVADANKISFVSSTTESGIPVLIVVPAGTDGAFTEIKLTEDGLNSAKVIIKGLDSDSYVLHETAAPAGYNAADDTTVEAATLVAIDGTITDAANAIDGDSHVVTVVNLTGAELPSTGGMGTTLFYIIGGILVIGAVVLLITRRRMRDAE